MNLQKIEVPCLKLLARGRLLGDFSDLHLFHVFELSCLVVTHVVIIFHVRHQYSWADLFYSVRIVALFVLIKMNQLAQSFTLWKKKDTDTHIIALINKTSTPTHPNSRDLNEHAHSHDVSLVSPTKLWMFLCRFRWALWLHWNILKETKKKQKKNDTLFSERSAVLFGILNWNWNLQSGILYGHNVRSNQNCARQSNETCLLDVCTSVTSVSV